MSAVAQVAFGIWYRPSCAASKPFTDRVSWEAETEPLDQQKRCYYPIGGAVNGKSVD